MWAPARGEHPAAWWLRSSQAPLRLPHAAPTAQRAFLEGLDRLLGEAATEGGVAEEGADHGDPDAWRTTPARLSAAVLGAATAGAWGPATALLGSVASALESDKRLPLVLLSAVSRELALCAMCVQHVSAKHKRRKGRKEIDAVTAAAFTDAKLAFRGAMGAACDRLEQEARTAEGRVEGLVGACGGTQALWGELGPRVAAKVADSQRATLRVARDRLAKILQQLK